MAEELITREIRCMHCDKTYEADVIGTLSCCPSCGNWNRHKAQLAKSQVCSEWGDSGRGRPTLQEPDGEEGGCPECNGSRQVPRYKRLYSIGAPAGLAICPTCQGKGKRADRDEFATINEWLDKHGIDRAYKKDMRETYEKEKANQIIIEGKH